jgi:methylated-DNA-[protein]-cysteine S-methyltransferase
MGQAAHRYLIFETRGGFCGIAWNNAGITRFQLPTKSAEATERMLLRRAPGAKPGAPTPEVAEAVAAVKRYFEGKETDFSGFKLDLGEQDPFFQRIYPGRGRSDGAARPLTALWRRNSAPGRKLRAMSARPWRRIRWL